MQLLKDHIYYNENIVIGGSLNAIKYAHEKGYHLINNCMDIIFPFDKNSDELFLELKLETDLELYNSLCYELYNKSLSMFSDKVRKVNVDLDEGMLNVITKGNSNIRVKFNKLFVYDFENVSGLDHEITIPEHYRIFDWFDVRSGTNHELAMLESDDNFCKKIYFYLSERIDGNNKYKDLVAESLLTSDQLNDVNYSNSIVRLKIIKMMKDNGIKGRSKGVNRRSPIEIEFYKRDVIPVKNRKLYEFSSRRDNTSSRSTA